MTWTDLGGVRRLVAVVGCQRSGTTLTGQLLGARAGAVLIDEFDGLYPWFHAMAAGRAGEAGTSELLARAASKYHEGDGRFVSTEGGVSLSGAVGVLVLKAPNLTFDAGALARFPLPVTVVQPVRDPRAVVASMARLEHIDFLGNQLGLLQARPQAMARHAAACAEIADESLPPWRRRAVLWRVKSGCAPEFEAAGLPVHRFRYEDLVVRPEPATAALLEFCGLDASRPEPPASAVLRGIGPGATDRTRAVDTASLQTWRRALPPDRAAEVLDAAQPLAEQLGYE